MFEGNIRQAGYEAALEGEVLRPLDWAGLAARLAAAQDLRQIQARLARGNFAHFSAGYLPEVNCEVAGVNPEDLAHRKAGAANMARLAGTLRQALES